MGSKKRKGQKKFHQNFEPFGLIYTNAMAWTPPINRKEKKHLFNEERFYSMLAKKCPHITKDEAFLLYIGIVNLVEQELRVNKVIRLPHLGDFALVQQKARPGWTGAKQVMLEEREVLKFYPKERLRRYFNQQQTTSQ